MKTLNRLFSKVFKTRKQTELTEAQLDAWIVSIRQAPQLSNTKYSDIMGQDSNELELV
jgi:hypothetical protein